MTKKPSFFERLTGTVNVKDYEANDTAEPEYADDARDTTLNDFIEEENGDGQLTVDVYQNPDEIINIEVLSNEVLVTGKRQAGIGGLPLGSSEKLLSLLSGGIDSPVASWMMMKRGCTTDCLHIHSNTNNQEVLNSKMKMIMETLGEYSPKPLRMFVIPYHEFYKKTISIDSRIELVIFRRYILKLGNRIAKEHGHFGLVTGDSVGQVASQTLENLLTTDAASELPVYRPLIAMDKKDIITIAKKIGTYEASIEQYKDCCSLVAEKHPKTKVKISEAMEAEEKLDEVIEKNMKEIEVFEF